MIYVISLNIGFEHVIRRIWVFIEEAHERDIKGFLAAFSSFLAISSSIYSPWQLCDHCQMQFFLHAFCLHEDHSLMKTLKSAKCAKSASRARNTYTIHLLCSTFCLTKLLLSYLRFMKYKCYSLMPFYPVILLFLPFIIIHNFMSIFYVWKGIKVCRTKNLSKIHFRALYCCLFILPALLSRHPLRTYSYVWSMLSWIKMTTKTHLSIDLEKALRLQNVVENGDFAIPHRL